MSFLEYVFGEDIAPSRYKCYVTSDSQTRVEGVKSIVNLSPSTITLLVKGGVLSLKGKDLSVKSYCYGDIVLSGAVFLVEEVGKIKDE